MSCVGRANILTPSLICMQPTKRLRLDVAADFEAEDETNRLSLCDPAGEATNGYDVNCHAVAASVVHDLVDSATRSALTPNYKSILAEISDIGRRQLTESQYKVASNQSPVTVNRQHALSVKSKFVCDKIRTESAKSFVDDSELARLRMQIVKLEMRDAKWRAMYASLQKQCRDLTQVLRKYVSDLNLAEDKTRVVPTVLRRAVALQVCPKISESRNGNSTVSATQTSAPSYTNSISAMSARLMEPKAQRSSSGTATSSQVETPILTSRLIVPSMASSDDATVPPVASKLHSSINPSPSLPPGINLVSHSPVKALTQVIGETPPAHQRASQSRNLDTREPTVVVPGTRKLNDSLPRLNSSTIISPSTNNTQEKNMTGTNDVQQSAKSAPQVIDLIDSDDECDDGTSIVANGTANCMSTPQPLVSAIVGNQTPVVSSKPSETPRRPVISLVPSSRLMASTNRKAGVTSPPMSVSIGSTVQPSAQFFSSTTQPNERISAPNIPKLPLSNISVTKTNTTLQKNLPPQPVVAAKVIVKDGNAVIMLNWNLDWRVGIHEEIIKYQVFAYKFPGQDGSGKVAIPTTSQWKKVGEVNSLPLPMACTLSKFHRGHTYFFAVRAVDKHMRTGAFSESKSVKLPVGPVL